MSIFLFIEIIVFLILVGGSSSALYLLYYKNRKKQRFEWESSRNYVVIKILVPRENEKTPIAAEQMFASLHGIFKDGEKFQDQIGLELVAKEKFIQFYVRVPEHLKDFVEGQIYAQYPEVEIVKVTDYIQEIDEKAIFAGCELLLNKNEVYPLKSFANFDVDPLSAITSVLGKVEKDEQIWLQILIRPVSDEWQEKGINYISAVRSGRPIKPGGNILSSIVSGFFRLIFDLLKTASGRATTTESATSEAAPVKLSSIDESGIKEIERKIIKLGFESKIRIIALSSSQPAAISKVNAVAGVFKQFNNLNSNGFRLGQIMVDEKFIEQYKARDFTGHGYILNIEELASIYHLPTSTVETPHIVWAGSKKGEPPTNLPLQTTTAPEEVTIFAKTDYRDSEHKFGIKTIDRRLHMYAIGKTGTGKSTLLENMVMDDIRQGRGVAVVDPHGELIGHVLDFIPENRMDDVVYFNPADKDYPIGFNPLENVDPDLKNIVASGVVGIFKKIFGESWGPRLEYILRNAILALLEYPDSTLLGVMRILVDKDFRKAVVAKITDPVVKDFFVNEYDKWDQKFRLEAIQSIQNKVGQFLSSTTIRNVVGQPKSSFDIRDVMNKGKILLLDLSIGRIGEDNASLLGAMMITKIQLAAIQRADIPEKDRRDFYLFVDEFQNFATDSFAIILSEARKYHLNLIMTNQYIAQMPELVAKAVFGNVGTLISFRVGSQDATSLVKEYEPVFDANDLVNLSNYSIYVKMAIDGVTRPAFSAITLPPHHEKAGDKEKVIKLSREKYARERSTVEEKIQEWSTAIEKAAHDRTHLVESEEQEPDTKKEEIVSGYKIVKDIHNQKWYIAEEAKGDRDSKGLINIEDLSDLDKTKRPKQSNLTELKAGESVKIDST